MSLNRYHNSRASDNVFKLLHEENSYLDILKGNVKALHQDKIGEKTSTEKSDDKQLLHEQDPGVDTVKDSKVDEKPEDEGTPDQQAKAVEKAAEKAAEADKKMGVKEASLKKFVGQKLEEISIAVARQGAARLAKQKALATRGLLRSKGPMKKVATPKRVVPGLRG